MGLLTIGLLSIALSYDIIAAVVPTDAQQTGRVYRLGVLYPGSASWEGHLW